MWVKLTYGSPATTYWSKVKVIHIMKVHNMLSHGDTSMCKIWYSYVKKHKQSCPYQISWKNINFYIEAKGHSHTEVMNVCDTLSYSDTLMCQIWYDYSIDNKRPMGHIGYLKYQLKSMNTFERRYDYIHYIIGPAQQWVRALAPQVKNGCSNPSPAMVTSPYELKILKWDNKPQTKK